MRKMSYLYIVETALRFKSILINIYSKCTYYFVCNVVFSIKYISKMDITIPTLLFFSIILEIIQFVGNSFYKRPINKYATLEYCHCQLSVSLLRLFLDKLISNKLLTRKPGKCKNDTFFVYLNYTEHKFFFE